jgi:hypothetical protein
VTREQFTARAVRDAERALQVPPGWWGVWRDVTDGIARIHFSSGGWTVSVRGKRVSRHDSRTFAISKARRLAQ